MTDLTRQRLRTCTVWFARIIVGVTFVLSGFAKCIDPAGTLFKIEDYVSAWGMTPVYVFDITAAFSLAVVEFVIGVMLLLGCYRRVVTWLLIAVMSVMLPLTLYIWIADPVSDCGCFGDMLVISNGATFAKNIVLTALVITLAVWNKQGAAVVRPAFQWIACVLSIAYAFTLAFIGYNYQPLIDFRPYPVGTSLATDTAEGDDAADEVSFIYEKDGVHATFHADSLPDDSWTYVDRVSSTKSSVPAGIAFYDEYGDDVSDEAIDTDGDQLLVLIPDASSIGYSRAHLIRTFEKAMESIGGRMTVVLAGDRDGDWRNHIGSGLQVLEAEDTSIKELARGEIALVYLTSGRIRWKLNVSSLPTDYLDSANFSRNYPLGRLAINSDRWLWSLSTLYVCALVLLAILPWLILQVTVKRRNFAQ